MPGSEYVYGTSKILVNFLFGFERSCKNMLDSGFTYIIVSTINYTYKGYKLTKQYTNKRYIER